MYKISFGWVLAVKRVGVVSTFRTIYSARLQEEKVVFSWLITNLYHFSIWARWCFLLLRHLFSCYIQIIDTQQKPSDNYGRWSAVCSHAWPLHVSVSQVRNIAHMQIRIHLDVHIQCSIHSQNIFWPKTKVWIDFTKLSMWPLNLDMILDTHFSNIICFKLVHVCSTMKYSIIPFFICIFTT